MATQEKHIGWDIKAAPSAEADKHDPFKGGFGIRGSTLVGKVISSKSAKTVTVQIERRIPVKKYKRSITRTYKIRAHNPETINAKDGDIVRIAETRPISKTKHFCVISIVSEEKSQ